MNNEGEQQSGGDSRCDADILRGIDSIITRLAASGEEELSKCEQADLERYWQFRWSEGAALEWNLYEFHKALDLYGSFCRRWEETRHGRTCVVERVRDTYLMPKIRRFIGMMQEDAHDPTGGEA